MYKVISKVHSRYTKTEKQRILFSFSFPKTREYYAIPTVGKALVG